MSTITYWEMYDMKGGLLEEPNDNPAGIPSGAAKHDAITLGLLWMKYHNVKKARLVRNVIPQEGNLEPVTESFYLRRDDEQEEAESERKTYGIHAYTIRVKLTELYPIKTCEFPDLQETLIAFLYSKIKPRFRLTKKPKEKVFEVYYEGGASHEIEGRMRCECQGLIDGYMLGRHDVQDHGIVAVLRTDRVKNFNGRLRNQRIENQANTIQCRRKNSTWRRACRCLSPRRAGIWSIRRNWTRRTRRCTFI